MTGACRGFGISCKTGYKVFNQYKQSGFESLSDHHGRKTVGLAPLTLTPRVRKAHSGIAADGVARHARAVPVEEPPGFRPARCDHEEKTRAVRQSMRFFLRPCAASRCFR